MPIKYKTIKIDETFYNTLKEEAQKLDMTLNDFMQLNFHKEPYCAICGIRKSLHFMIKHKFVPEKR